MQVGIRYGFWPVVRPERAYSISAYNRNIIEFHWRNARGFRLLFCVRTKWAAVCRCNYVVKVFCDAIKTPHCSGWWNYSIKWSLYLSVNEATVSGWSILELSFKRLSIDGHHIDKWNKNTGVWRDTSSSFRMFDIVYRAFSGAFRLLWHVLIRIREMFYLNRKTAFS